MRRARVKVGGSAYYHVMSRCALQQFLLTGEVKEMFLKILRRAECFSGVRVVNYCVMDNHFHVLVHVPERREVPDVELEERIRVLYGLDKARRIVGHWEALRKLGAEAAIEREKAAYRRRMYDLSEFMKTFKQRFSLWYCSNHGNLEGTIWQGPFHSVLVEGRHDALDAVSAYITLNPVRAKLVGRPEEFRWSAYGAAVAGDRRARSALLSGYGEGAPFAKRWRAYAAMIEVAMAEGSVDEGAVQAQSADSDKVGAPPVQTEFGGRHGAKTGKAGEGGKAKMVTVLRVRNRDISRGVAFGSAEFVALAIRRASNTTEVLTFPKAFCLGADRTSLCCAGRRRGA